MSTSNHPTFEKILRPHMDRLYRLAWRLTGRKAEAEDLFIDEQRRFARRRMHTVEEGELSGDGLAGLPGARAHLREILDKDGTFFEQGAC